ncbi:BTB/POZ protein [Rhizophagus irregularis DAOM 181602=DAOM 197198]|nr:BTB/POZ protein [Rhizophagus irregularis DAOM 181602=DAOM 197198]
MTNEIPQSMAWILASNKNRNKENILSHIKLSKISPEVFQIILKYIYGGTLSLNEQDTLEILKILIAAEELLLQELVDYLQKYFIENKSKWMEQHFELIHRTSFQSNSLLELQQFLKGTEEILGGYNPLKWESSGGCGKAVDSFIFSFKNDNVEDRIISNVKYTDYAIRYGPNDGPFFGFDIIIHAAHESEVYNETRYKKNYYKKKIRDTEGQFTMEDFEVFQIIKR